MNARADARALVARDNMSNRLLNLITYNLHNRHTIMLMQSGCCVCIVVVFFT